MTRHMRLQQVFNSRSIIRLLTVMFCLISIFVYAQAIVPDYNTEGRPLPPGVPRVVDTNGNVLFIDTMFSSTLYQKYACAFLLHEANSVAHQLDLNEPPVITTSNLIGGFISPFGFAYAYKRLGNISTTNFIYGAERDYKFSDVTITRIDDHCREFVKNYRWPIKLLDTNAAYQLATQWLAAVDVDVNGLNNSYDVHVDLDPYWNNVRMGQRPNAKFTPIYCISWLVRGKPLYSSGNGASIELFLPAKTLLSLSVEDPKFILRQALSFTNLNSLFPGTARIITNSPIVIHLSAPGPN